MPAITQPIRAPELLPGEWVNSDPLTLAGLAGRVVLLEFWDYTCINCLHTLPYLQRWWQRYRDAGLLIIGVHSPLFRFGRRREYVRRAAERLGLEFPILLDNDWQNLRTWHCRVWPSRYIVDAQGLISYFHYGEGGYQEMEFHLQLLLQQVQPGASFPAPLPLVREADEPGMLCYHSSPDLMLGYQHGHLGNREGYKPDQIVVYTDPGSGQDDMPYLQGHWRDDAESVTLVAGEGSVRVRYQAKEVAIIAQPPDDEDGVLQIEQDGVPLTEETAGTDVRLAGDRAVVLVDEPRLYHLVNNLAFGTHTVRVRALTPGTSLFGITFVTDCVETES